MICNGVTEYLRRRCRDDAARYQREYLEELADTGRSLRFIQREFADEMAYKLSSLVDWDADSFEGYREKVRSLAAMRMSFLLRRERDPEALGLLEEAEEAFLKILASLTPEDRVEPEFYYRVILGEEKEALAYAILEKWDYSTAYWYPLRGSFDESKLFIHMDWFEPYLDRLCQMIGLPGTRIYEYGESFYGDSHCAEVDDIFCYGGNEAVYLPKNLSWIIYFSHESTVTFAGSILPMVRELLAPVREHWNRWE